MVALPKPVKKEKRRPKPLRRSKPIAKRSRPRGRSRNPLARMEAEAWRLTSLMVRRARPLCQKCWRYNSTDVAHVFRRGCQSVKFDWMNLLALCRACHDGLGNAHLTKPSDMEDFYREYMGSMAFEDLKIKARVHRKFSPITYNWIVAEAARMGIPIRPVNPKDIPH